MAVTRAGSGPTESYPHAGRPIGPPVGTHHLLELRKLSAARDVVLTVIKTTISGDSRARVARWGGFFFPKQWRLRQEDTVSPEVTPASNVRPAPKLTAGPALTI